MNKADCARLEAKAEALGAKIVYDVEGRLGAYSCIEEKTIHLLKEDADAGGSSYVVAMHELGHIVTTEPVGGFSRSASLDAMMAQALLGFQSDPPGQIEIEAKAWLWGFDNASRRLTREDKAIAAFSVSTYLLGVVDLFGAWPIEKPPREAVARLAEVVGPVDWSKAEILDWIPGERDHEDEFDRAWNEVMVPIGGGRLVAHG